MKRKVSYKSHRSAKAATKVMQKITKKPYTGKGRPMSYEDRLAFWAESSQKKIQIAQQVLEKPQTFADLVSNRNKRIPQEILEYTLKARAGCQRSFAKLLEHDNKYIHKQAYIIMNRCKHFPEASLEYEDYYSEALLLYHSAIIDNHKPESIPTHVLFTYKVKAYTSIMWNQSVAKAAQCQVLQFDKEAFESRHILVDQNLDAEADISLFMEKSLSRVQRKVLQLKREGMSLNEIKRTLKIKDIKTVWNFIKAKAAEYFEVKHYLAA